MDTNGHGLDLRRLEVKRKGKDMKEDEREPNGVEQTGNEVEEI